MAQKRWKELIAEQLEEIAEDSLGHAPDDCIVEPVGLDLTPLTSNLEAGKVIAARLKQAVDGNPLGRGHFGVQNERGTRGQEEEEGSNRNRRENRHPGHYIVQAAEQLLRNEVDSDLFTGFPDDGGKKFLVLWLAPPTRQRHVAGPGITGPLRPSNEQDCVGIWGKNDGHSSPQQRRVVVDTWLMLSQAFAQAGEPAGQCE